MLRFKKWEIRDFDGYKEIMDKFGVSSLAAKAICARKKDIDPEKFLSSKDFLYSPFELKDMDRAVDRINLAIDNGEKITVYGDYDADGVCATVILSSYLEAMGADVNYYIPSREDEGYGLNAPAIDKLKNEGCQLIVTVDNGIAAYFEIEYAKSLGIDVVVTDHHKPQEKLPDCIVVDPHRTDCKSVFKDICGAFVAFKLVAALDLGEYEGALEQYAELVAIATIADVVPLVSENRTIVKFGIENIKQSSNLGIVSLIGEAFSAETQIDSTSLAFGIVPRINAAGRMGSAEDAAELLLCEDMDNAQRLCEELCHRNEERKNIENEILKEINDIFKNQPYLLNDRVIVVCGENWHHGVLGIVAAKILERTGKPCVVLSKEAEEASGSARSVEGFDIFAALCSCSELFTKFGGHSLAAGITLPVEKVNRLRTALNSYAEDNFKIMPQKTILADAQITLNEITLSAVKELNLLEPIGKDNPQPVFAMYSLEVSKISSIANGKHSRITFNLDSQSFTAVYFGVTESELAPFIQKKVDVCFRLKTNVYQGIESVSIQVVDLRPEKINDNLFFKEKNLLESVVRFEELSKREAQYVYPTRNEAVEIYKILKTMPNYNRGIDMLWFSLGGRINIAKLGVIIEAFRESSLASVSDDVISINAVNEKKDLFSSDILKHISGYLAG